MAKKIVENRTITKKVVLTGHPVYTFSQTYDGKYQLTVVYMRLKKVSNDSELRTFPKYIFKHFIKSLAFNFPTPALLNWPFCGQITNLSPASEVAGGHTLPF
jgi:hypothetical protein